MRSLGIRSEGLAVPLRSPLIGASLLRAMALVLLVVSTLSVGPSSGVLVPSRSDCCEEGACCCGHDERPTCCAGERGSRAPRLVPQGCGCGGHGAGPIDSTGLRWHVPLASPEVAPAAWVDQPPCERAAVVLGSRSPAPEPHPPRR